MQITTSKKILLGMQHVLAMFGATVLVPLITGLDSSIALLCAGLGTLVFHSVTKGIVPVFLGSSFAFMAAIQLTLNNYGLAAVKGGVIAAGFIYILIGLLVKTIGVERIKSLFPPIVTGPMIMVIGLGLSPVAIQDSFYKDGQFEPLYLFVAFVVLITMVVCSIFAKGFFKLVPILIAIVVGYVVALIFGIVDTQPILDASWISLFDEKVSSALLTVPSFGLSGIIAIAPIAVVVFIEHIGDMTTNGAVVGKDFFKDPGVHRTLLGDGLASILAGFLGGPANTTYSENTGVLAVTKVYDPAILRIAAIFAVLLGLVGKFGAFISTIPGPVRGGVSIILFGMIASTGVRILVNAKMDFSHSRNLIISAVILVLGIGVDSLPITSDLTISGMAMAALCGIILNKILPQEI